MGHFPCLIWQIFITINSLVSIFGEEKKTCGGLKQFLHLYSCWAFLLPDLGLESTREEEEEEVLGRPTSPLVYMFPSLQLLIRASPWLPPQPPPHPPVTAFTSLDDVTDGDRQVSITLIFCWLYFTFQQKNLSYLPNEYWHEHLEFLLWFTRAALHDSQYKIISIYFFTCVWLNLIVCSLKQVILVLCPLSRLSV